MMKHDFKRIVRAEVISEGVLSLEFDCGVTKKVDLNSVLKGSLFGQLQDYNYFKKIEIDREVGTIYWPNGADFDPDTLFRWDEVVGEIASHLKSA